MNSPEKNNAIRLLYSRLDDAIGSLDANDNQFIDVGEFEEVVKVVEAYSEKVYEAAAFEGCEEREEVCEECGYPLDDCECDSEE